jgi:hypothetical protein
MDFTWVTTDDANAIQNSIVDAKGDLISATGNDTPARLAVGNNGETLVADSSATTGLRWQGDYAAGKNKIINGDFGIWQRGTTSSTAGYLADRWTLTFSVAPTTFAQSRQTFTPGTAPVAGYEGKFFWRYAITTVGSSTDMYIGQLIEDVQTFAGQTMTFSIWLKADSARSVSLSYNQVFGSGGSGSVSASMATFSVTTAWTRFSATVTIPSIAGKTIGTSSYLQFFISSTPASGFSLDCWGVQAEAGSVATAFQTATGTIQGELAACQRYYEKSYNQATAPANAASTTNVQPIGVAYTTGIVRVGNVLFKVTKRAQPVVTLYNTNVTASAGNWAYYLGGWGAPTSTSASTILQTGFLVDISKTSTFTAQNAYMTDGDWAADAEL